jgi:hypothetical protein
MTASRKSRCKRNQHGGGLGNTVGFAAGSPLINNDLAWKSGSSCVAEQRFGFLPNGFTGPQGLPGMSGGRRKGRKGSRRGRKAQRGGGYGIAAYDGTLGTQGGLAPIQSVPCEASRSAIPDSGAANTLNVRGGTLWDGPIAPKGMIGGGNTESIIVPTARYSDLADPSGIRSAAGTNIMIHTPLNASEMNPACIKTGGARKKRSTKRKHHKKTKRHTRTRRH